MRPIGQFLLALSPAALASTTWYVNGTTGRNTNGCKSPTTARKAIGHPISFAEENRYPASL